MSLETIGRVILSLGILLLTQFISYVVFNMMMTRLEQDVDQPYVLVAWAIIILLALGLAARYIKGTFL